MAEEYDVIIIGTGAGGGTLARALAPTGKRILVLEKGGYIPREKDNLDSRAVWVDKKYGSGETWYNHGKAFQPNHPHYCVGGSTKFYGAALLRLREGDFQEFPTVDGLSPAWPITYGDLEPYYAEAEEWYYVHGEAGADPTEPPRTGPYPYPPLVHEPRIQRLSDDLAARGLKPFPLPMGMRMTHEREAGATADLNLWPQFDGYPDPFEIKADSHIVGIRPALQHDNVTLKIHSPVERLETDATGRRVTNVVVKKADGTEERYQAGTIIVAAGAIGSALLFLRSINDRHPDGLANGSGLVGRNYMGHNNATVVVISKEPNDATFEKTLAFADYYWGDEDFEFPMGLVQMLGKINAEMMSFDAPEPFPGMTHADMAAHSLDFWLQAEDLGRPENRVYYNEEGQVVFHYHANNVAAIEALTARLKDLLNYIGCRDRICELNHYLGGMIRVPLGHEMGTLRMGTEPRTSVLDPYCRAHELDNLYVTDGSFMVSAGAVNPTLTIIAQTLRTAAYLKSQVL